MLAALIQALGVIIVNALAERSQATAEARMIFHCLVVQASREHVQISRGARQLVRALAQREAVRRREASAGEAVCQKILAESTIYHNIGAISSDGEVFSTAYPQKQRVNVSGRAYFQSVLRTKDLQVSGLQLGRISGRPSLV